MFQTTCFDIWRKANALPKIITLIRELDEELDGGIPLGIITEFVGAPGMGKTQICLQLCINVQLPQQIGGVDGKAFYIDTNQGFSPYRLKEIAKHTNERFQQAIQHAFTTNNENTCTTATVQTLLENISYVYCPHYEELMASVLNLRNTLQEDNKLKLIIIDSFSYLIRFVEDVKLRTRLIYELLTDLQRIALEFNVAIIITNEITCRMLNGNWNIAPALGETHSHKINQRIILTQEISNNYRLLIINKSVVSAPVAIRFKIKNSGVRSFS